MLKTKSRNGEIVASIKILSVIGITLAVLLLAGGANATPSKQWDRTFGGKDSDVAYYIQQTSDSGYIFAGVTGGYNVAGQLYYDGWLVKIDSLGNRQWDRSFGGAMDDQIYAVQQTTDGGFILAGVEGSYDDAWLIKTDANGNQLWSKTFGGAGKDVAKAVQQTSDGGYILTGGYSTGGGSYDACLIKTDANGNQSWSKVFSDSEIANSVQQTSDGGYILTGYTGLYKDSTSDTDGFLIKTDANGNQLWNKRFGGKMADSINSVQQTSDGGYILAGYTRSYGAGGSDAWLIKTDANGNEQWNRVKTFGGSGNDVVNSVRQTSDGGYIFVGGTEPYGAVKPDVWVIKTDADGNEQWSRTFAGRESEWANSVQQTLDGGYILAGLSYPPDIERSDAWIIKLSSESGTTPVSTPTTTPTLTPTPTPTSTPIITETPTPVPTPTHTPTPIPTTNRMPGFEIVLALVSVLTMLTISYLSR